MTDDDELGDGPEAESRDGEPDSAASPKTIRRKRINKEWSEREEQEFWRRTLRDPVGRRVMWGIFTETQAFEAIHAAGPSGVPDPLATEYYRGRTTFGFALYLRLAAMDRASILLMHDENDAKFPKSKPRTAKPRMTRG
jgi:hypothetical protein